MRGTYQPLLFPLLGCRFIPACAGNIRNQHQTPVHPRVCGEHFSDSASGPAKAGSSPRVRGTCDTEEAKTIKARFIPACAGNICWSNSQPADRAVHPRVCGEHLVSCRGGNPKTGSSPRVRGTFSHDLLGGQGRRFIPACAGNMNTGRRGPDLEPVHPRVCGEHDRYAIFVSTTAGSSPRVRGTFRHHHAHILHGRFIPACAGNIVAIEKKAASGSVHPRVCGEHMPITRDGR